MQKMTCHALTGPTHSRSGGTSYGNLRAINGPPGPIVAAIVGPPLPSLVPPPRCGTIMAAIVSPGDHLWHETPP